MAGVKRAGRWLPFVEVTWVDAHTPADRSWQTLKEADAYHGAAQICTTIGAIVKRDRRGITLAMSMSPSGHVGGLWHVPAGMVRQVKRLRRR